MQNFRKSFREGNIAIKLIYINIFIFLVALILNIFGTLMLNPIHWIQWVALPSDLPNFASIPWTIFSYMFIHEGFIHLLFNLLTLYWFSSFFLQYYTEKQLFGVYFIGGIVGGLFYMLCYQIFPYFQQQNNVLLIGASASILSIVTTIAVTCPNRSIRLMFIGDIYMKYIALFFLFLSILCVAGENAGGNLAHIGGIIWGFIYAKAYRKGKDLVSWFNIVIDKIASIRFHFKPKMKVFEKKSSTTDVNWNYQKAQNNKAIDNILDKIKKSGYDSLTQEEKKKLFDKK